MVSGIMNGRAAGSDRRMVGNTMSLSLDWIATPTTSIDVRWTRDTGEGIAIALPPEQFGPVQGLGEWSRDSSADEDDVSSMCR